MAEILISIRMERRSRAASIRVSMGAKTAGGTHSSPFVGTELGEGPLLPEMESMSYPIEAQT